MNTDIELHVFTNSTKSAPDTSVIEKTIGSFNRVFGNVPVTCVWHDPNPNLAAADAYHANLQQIFPDVRKTTSLADGYTTAIKEAKSEFLFMLEHDWEFIEGNITHSLDEICLLARDENILHLRFNRFESNLPDGWDVKLIERGKHRIPYCITPALSNNPHIIQRDKYLKEAIQHIRVSPGGQSKGIEIELLRAKHLYGAIYGSLRHPATIRHLDARGIDEETNTIIRFLKKLGIKNWIHLWYAHRKMREFARGLPPEDRSNPPL